jgi:hypothetical protein
VGSSPTRPTDRTIARTGTALVLVVLVSPGMGLRGPGILNAGKSAPPRHRYPCGSLHLLRYRRSGVPIGRFAALELGPDLSVLVVTITGMKLRLLRIGDHLDEDTVLVRGGELDPGVLRADARRYHEVYGTYLRDLALRRTRHGSG